jgi:hypothetical protein
MESPVVSTSGRVPGRDRRTDRVRTIRAPSPVSRTVHLPTVRALKKRLTSHWPGATASARQR